MSKMTVIDNSGVWINNRSQFRMVDGESGVIYEPGLPMKVKDTEWRKARGDILVEVEDPLAPPPAPIKAETVLRDGKKK